MNFNDGVPRFERAVMPVYRKRLDNKQTFRTFTPTDSFIRLFYKKGRYTGPLTIKPGPLFDFHKKCIASHIIYPQNPRHLCVIILNNKNQTHHENTKSMVYYRRIQGIRF